MRKTRRHRGRRVLFCTILLLGMLGGYSYWALSQPIPALQPTADSRQLQIKTSAGVLSWPGGQAAVGVVGENVLETHGTQTPIPIASTSKMITALLVLEKRPLALNQAGASIAITEDDVQRYRTYLAQGGSVAPVQAGTSLTQYQMLQAMMLPSGNNIADSLAIWAYGSLEAYRVAANQYLAKQGISKTSVGSDASGLAPDSTSTAQDLVRIGTLVMESPVLAQIVGQSEAVNFPVAGTLKNTNYLLGSDGIVGLKTGSSDQAGGAFVGAAQVQVDGVTKTIVTAVIGSPNRQIAMQGSAALIKSARANFAPITFMEQGQVVGNYALPWGGTVSAVTAKDVTVSAWKGSIIKGTVSLAPTQNDPKAGQVVGTLAAQDGLQSTDIKLTQTPSQPSTWWRLTHPFD